MFGLTTVCDSHEIWDLLIDLLILIMDTNSPPIFVSVSTTNIGYIKFLYKYSYLTLWEFAHILRGG